MHLHTGQYASAFHYFSASVNLKPDFAHSYMYLAVTLARLDDFENACAAYEKAIQMAGAPGEPVFHLNYGERAYQAASLMLYQELQLSVPCSTLSTC